jgi:hypothetical protein
MFCSSHTFSSPSEGSCLSSSEQSRFNNAISKLCKLVKKAAKLKQRVDKFNEIKTNVIVLVQRYAKAKPSYSGYERIIQMGLSLRFFPFYESTCTSPEGNYTSEINHETCNSNKTSGKAGTTPSGLDPTGERFRYDSWLKWSDDSVQSLNILKKLKDMTGSDKGECKKFIPIKIIYGGSVTATINVGVKDATAGKITIAACAVFHYKGDDKSKVNSMLYLIDQLVILTNAMKAQI